MFLNELRVVFLEKLYKFENQECFKILQSTEKSSFEPPNKQIN